MLTFLKQWFAPPVFEDEEATRRAGLVSICINVLSVGALVAWIGLQFGSFLPPTYAVAIFLLFFLQFLRWMLKRGWIRQAGFLLGFIVSIAISLALATLGTIRTPGVAILTLSIVAAELLSGGRAALGMVILNSIFVGVLIIAERTGILPDPPSTVGIPQWIILVATFGVLGGFLHLATRTIRDSLTRARHELEERQRAELKLNTSEQYFRALIENIGEVITLLDVNGTALYVSPAVQRTLGYLPEERINRDGFELIHPDDLAYVQARFREVIATPDHQVSAEFRLLHKNGQWRWVSATGKNSLANPNMQAVIVNYRDITENKRVEDALRNNETRFRSILAAIPDLIFISGADGMYYDIFTIHEERLGIPRDQVIGRTIHEIFTPEISQAFQEKLDEAVATREVIEYEYILPSTAGGDSWFQARAVAYDTPEGLRIVWLVRDVSEQKQAEAEIRQLNAELEARVEERTAQLQAANHELEAFAYSVSHDLRTPLRAIDGFTTILSDLYGHQFDAQGQRYLTNVQQAAQRMGMLIDDLLKLSRISRKEFHRLTCVLSEMAEEIMVECRREQPERQANIHIQPDLIVQGDPSLLRVMLENLLGNAWKFTGKKPLAEIEFGVNEVEKEKVYFVKDNGAGFDMAYADRLFGAFQRLHQYEEFEGTGIGLATVQRIVHRHGGRIWAEAEVEQGASFYFTLAE